MRCRNTQDKRWDSSPPSRTTTITKYWFTGLQRCVLITFSSMRYFVNFQKERNAEGNCLYNKKEFIFYCAAKHGNKQRSGRAFIQVGDMLLPAGLASQQLMWYTPPPIWDLIWRENTNCVPVLCFKGVKSILFWFLRGFGWFSMDI